MKILPNYHFLQTGSSSFFYCASEKEGAQREGSSAPGGEAAYTLVQNNAEHKSLELLILPLRNTVLYPDITIPITVAREKSIQVVKQAYSTPDKIIGVIAQKNPEIEDPHGSDLYTIGTQAVILRMIRMPDGSITVVIQGQSRFQVQEFLQEEPYFKAKVLPLEEIYPGEAETKAMIISLKKEATRIIELAPNIPSEAAITLQSINNLSFLVHFIASNLNIELKQKQEILEATELMSRCNIVLELLAKELQLLELSEEIQNKVKSDLDKQQRDFILRQQMKTIQDELGEQSIEHEIEEFRKRAEAKKWPEAAQEAFEKEIKKLYRINPSSPEYGVSLNYIDWLLDLPWQEYTQDRFNLKLARKILDKEHYGLEKVKERIIEHLAVLKLKGNMKAPILCFYGPPGVGKTSLGRSIAKSLNRKFARISLGGVRDEAEIRGHRRTYIGSMPGRILQGLKKCKSGNPVFILDEIDKVGNDWRGDPSSALLEVLDPEQNNTFNDHYLEIDYDLSPIMFIATANSLETIHPALLDRMEVIEINGYTLEEKMQIAIQHLVPKQKQEHGIKKGQLNIPSDIIQKIIEGYTRESGVRKLTQQIAAICRGAAKDIVEHEAKIINLDEELLIKYLGFHKFEKETYEKQERPGVAVGLAWTAVGGEILFIETALMPGSGKLTLTGQLGEVMKESANLAYIYFKANARKYNVETEIFNQWDLHIHIPAGATPKDGPSAGTAILTAIASIFTERLVKPQLAMTGEITLRGKVLPVGGIKEKVLAAARAGIQQVLIPVLNKKDIEEIKTEQLKDLEIIFVETMDQVLELSLTQEIVPSYISLAKQKKEVPAPTLTSVNG
ncbi:MAG: endopeptidase La [Bacteroidia bacterium]|nr:endopeptidase La [Bacteroidia bacterium]MDW8159696.1 endopeptidase La [Bacteroidia bacterium]